MTVNINKKNNMIDSLLMQNEKLQKCIHRAISDLNWEQDFESTFEQIERELTVTVNRLQEILF